MSDASYRTSFADDAEEIRACLDHVLTERGYAQAGGFGQACLPFVMGHECGGTQGECGGHVEDVE